MLELEELSQGKGDEEFKELKEKLFTKVIPTSANLKSCA